jgi:prepilin-type N-terminal cleavage/methylation domain-containing protein
MLTLSRLLTRKFSFLPSSGFTMIEMLLSVSIMLVLVGGGVAAFVTFNDSQQLKGATKELQTYMRVAQTKARLGDRPPTCGRLDGYAVRVAESSNVLRMVAICDIGDVEVQTKTLEGITSIQVDNDVVDVEFGVLQGGVTNSGTISIQSDGGSVETFAVSAGGEIGTTGDDLAVPNATEPSPSPT